MYLDAKECEAVGKTDEALRLYRRMVKLSPVPSLLISALIKHSHMSRVLLMFMGCNGTEE